MSVRAPSGTDLAYHVGAHAHRYLASTVSPEHIKAREHLAHLCKFPIPAVEFEHVEALGEESDILYRARLWRIRRGSIRSGSTR